ncbi:hypothetical protein BKA65DRAFT_500262 [Rhexocercosporidium sp. MPI-PUGE-AT-0058]|nr:hypothetical protein BKA65DRAFT_500262 [Rhexocercosporidium sp. MPI-PUGE-AT-0058]
MDPITAINLASSLITFVDFASKVVTGTYEVYNSTAGSTIENAHIDTVISDLKEVAADLETSVAGKSKHERALQELASKCDKVANDLLQLLNRIKSDSSQSTLKSLKAILISMRKQKEITGLEKRLNDYRSQILTRLTLMLQDQNHSLKMQLDKLENASLTLSSESASRAKALREHIFQDIKHLLESRAPSNDTALGPRDLFLDLERGLQDLSSLITTVPRENIILENLYYDSLDLRERTIMNAENGTFEWLFKEELDQDESYETATEEVKLESPSSKGVEPENHSTSSSSEESVNVEEKHERVEVANGFSPSQAESASFTENEQRPGSPDFEWNETEIQYFEKEQLEWRAETRARFVAWLNSGRGVFHISGKAGSGKSTFMKFICSHERTEAELKEWAGQKKLVFAPFYFWKSQDEMQMSLKGLYRSILFITLRQCPELIPTVFPTHWEKLKNNHFMAGNFISYFDLVSAFEALTSTGTFPSHRFCYFVDGLDEYHGHSLEHVRLAKSLQRWARSPDVKICASSRPYIEYENLSPSSHQMIQLHQLTRHDIHLFCRQMVEKDDNFEQIKDSYLNLVARIVIRSQGVFLWARLVINSLLVGMLRHDNLETLKKKLSVIPGDLNQLYDQLLNSLDKDDRARAIKLLLLTAHPPYDFTIVTYWMFDNFDRLDFTPHNRARPASWPSTEKMANDARLQIKSLTKGLLETKTQRYGEIDIQKVDFFHRTARDFVLEQLEPSQKPDPGDEVIDLIIDKYAYALLRLAELTSYDLRTRKAVWAHSFALWVFRFTRKLSLEVMDAYRCLLDDYDSSIPTDPKSDDIFRGYIRTPDKFGYSMHRLSFVHMAAYTGQLDYVLREIEADPGLLDSGKELSVLASALSGHNIELVEALIKRGCSPADSISCWYQAEPEARPDGSIPIWLAVLQQDLGAFLRVPWHKCSFRIWELLLRHPQVNACNCFFLLSPRDKDTATYFITLRQFIEELKPDRMGKLLVLLDGGKDYSFMKGPREFLSRFIPVIRKWEPSLTTKTEAYIPYSLAEKKAMSVRAVVCDYIQADRCLIRVY